ncbi:MAG: oligosaccharide flippase family protein [Acidobacteria bacterium]|nr:oligosaccharide flippase family protein [Acidobacteriota bacterium]
MTADTTTRFFQSAGAATFSQAWRVGVTFLTTFFLMRKVGDGDFGIYDWTVVVFLVLGALRDLGLLYHIIRLKPRPYGNVLAVEIGWGALLALGTFFGADQIARGFSGAGAEVVPVIRAFSLFLFLDGLSSVPRVYFDAELRVGRTVLPEIIRNLLYAVTSLILAYLGYGLWSMVVGLLVGTAYYTAHLWIRAWPTIPLLFERGGTWSLIRPSLPLAMIWLLAILARHIDPLILGGLEFDDGTVGQYTRSYFFAFLVTITLVPAITRVLYPALVEYSEDPEKLSEAYRLATVFVLTLEAPVAAFLFLNTEAFLAIFGVQWTAAVPFLRVLSLAPLIDPFSRLGGEILKVYHRDRLWIVSLILTLLPFGIGGYFLISAFGPIGMAYANYLPIGGLVMAWGIHRIAPGPFARLVRDIGVIYLAPVLPFLAAYLVAGDRLWLRFGLSILAAMVTAAFYWHKFGHSFLTFFRDRSGEETTPVTAPVDRID